MDAYIYQADLLCEDCAQKTIKRLTSQGKAPKDPSDEDSFDSDDFPKGPYADGGGESDTPQNCGECGVFLENPLTEEGAAYVEDLIEQHLATGRGNAEVLREWADFYEIKFPHWSKKVWDLARGDKGKLPAHAWPGGYPIVYYDKDAEPICPKCAQASDWSDAEIVDYDAHWEGPPLQCANCNEEIESAYGDPDEDKKNPARKRAMKNPKRGPGKFDSDLDAVIYGMSLSGMADEDIGDVQEDGAAYSLLTNLTRKELLEAAEEDGTPLEEDDLIEGDGKSAIVEVMENGAVHVNLYDTEEAARKKWSKIEKALEPEDEESEEGDDEAEVIEEAGSEEEAEE